MSPFVINGVTYHIHTRELSPAGYEAWVDDENGSRICSVRGQSVGSVVISATKSTKERMNAATVESVPKKGREVVCGTDGWLF